jgi:hypothetical protein
MNTESGAGSGDDAPEAMSWLVTGQMLLRAAAAFSLLGASVLLGWFIMFHLVLKQIPFVRWATPLWRFDPLLPATLDFPLFGNLSAP